MTQPPLDWDGGVGVNEYRLLGLLGLKLAGQLFIRNRL